MEETEKKILTGQVISYGAIAGGILLILNNKKLGGWAGGIGLVLVVVGASKFVLEPSK